MEIEWRKESAGRYEGVSAAGRVGLVLGGRHGRGSWSAELPNGRSIGYFPTKKQAQEALERDFLDPVWRALVATVEHRPPHLLTSYHDDFYKLDRETVREWDGSTDFIFVLREHGTHLVPIDMEWSRREITALLDVYGESQAAWYWVRARTHDRKIVEQVSPAKVRELLRKPAIYQVRERFLVRAHGAAQEIVADLTVEKPEWRPNEAVRLLWEFRDEPFLSERNVAISAGFAWAARDARSLFAAPASIVVRHKGREIHSWTRQLR